MATELKSHTRFRRKGAFTLIEILVAFSIVALLVVLMNQMVGNTSRLTRFSQNRMDALTQAQMIFNRMDFDFAQMPLRSELDYGFSKNPYNDSFSFYSATEGIYPSAANPTPRTLSVIGYRIYHEATSETIPILERGARQLDWSSGGPARETVRYTQEGEIQKLNASGAGNTLPPIDVAGADSNYSAFGDQVFRMEICFLLKGDSTANTQPHLVATLSATESISNVSAIVVALATIDSSSRAIVADYSKLINSLRDAEDGKDILSIWNPAVNDPNFSKTAGIPVQAAQTVRIFQRYFYLK